MEKIPSREGTHIRADQAALIFDADGKMELLIPSVDQDAPLAPGHKLLIAIVAHLQNPKWVEHLLNASSKS